MTETLLLVGVVAAIVFVAVVLIAGAIRTDYDPTYHTASELALGEGGWLQTANFIVMGLAMFACALGVHQALDAPAAAVLLGIFGLGMITAGIFPPDPIRGYPPGPPGETPDEVSWQHQVHGVLSGPVAFFAIFAACLTLLGHLDGFWRLYTLATAAAGLPLTIWTAVAYTRDASNTGLVQRSLILVYWTWIALLGIHLA